MIPLDQLQQEEHSKLFVTPLYRSIPVSIFTVQLLRLFISFIDNESRIQERAVKHFTLKAAEFYSNRNKDINDNWWTYSSACLIP